MIPAFPAKKYNLLHPRPTIKPNQRRDTHGSSSSPAPLTRQPPPRPWKDPRHAPRPWTTERRRGPARNQTNENTKLAKQIKGSSKSVTGEGRAERVRGGGGERRGCSGGAGTRGRRRRAWRRRRERRRDNVALSLFRLLLGGIVLSLISAWWRKQGRKIFERRCGRRTVGLAIGFVGGLQHGWSGLGPHEALKRPGP